MQKFIEQLKKVNIVRLLHLDGYERQAIYAITIIVLVVVNFVVSPFSLRLDFSQGQAYTLSPATKKIVRAIDDIVTIKFYASDLPTGMLPIKTNVADLLKEYQKTSSRISVKNLDPKKDQDAMTSAKGDNIPELQLSQMEQDKYAVSTAYFGIAIQYGDKKEVIPQLNDLSSLEYNITAAIYKLTSKNTAKIGLVGIDQTKPNVTVNNLAQVLQQQFALDPVEVSTSAATKLSDYKTLLIVDNNAKSYDQGEIGNLRNYLNNKGNAVFFVDNKWIGDNFQVDDAKHNLGTLLGEYGLKMNNDLVLSADSEVVNFGGGNAVSFLTQYPFWLRTNNFKTENNGYFSSVRSLTFPWVSSVSIAKREGYQTTTLVESTPRSWNVTQQFDLTPQSITAPDPKDMKSFVIAAQSQNKKGGKVILIPSSRLILDRFVSRTSDAIGFVLNIVNDLASGGALSGIRSRAVNFYPLPQLPDNTKDIFKYANVLILPALLAAYAGWRLTRRNS